MPICFTLTRIDNREAGPVKLSQIDDEMCKDFDVEPDPVKYYMGWYDCIGFRLAAGKTFQQIRESFYEYISDPTSSKESQDYYTKMLGILAWIEARFTTDSWWEPKR